MMLGSLLNPCPSVMGYLLRFCRTGFSKPMSGAPNQGFQALCLEKQKLHHQFGPAGHHPF